MTCYTRCKMSEFNDGISWWSFSPFSLQCLCRILTLHEIMLNWLSIRLTESHLEKRFESVKFIKNYLVKSEEWKKSSFPSSLRSTWVVAEVKVKSKKSAWHLPFPIIWWVFLCFSVLSWARLKCVALLMLKLLLVLATFKKKRFSCLLYHQVGYVVGC